MLRILIADDHAILRTGIKEILLYDFPFALIEEVNDAEELLKKVISNQWDVVITDVQMPGRSGLDVLEQIKKSFPKLPVLVFSSHSENQYAVRVLRSGASGYITKDSAPHVLVDAVKQVLLGKKYITASVAEKLVSTLDHEHERPLHEQLSDREFEVMKLLVAGKSVSDIAEILSLSITTVSTYRARILQKMHMESNAELIYYAIEHDLI
jgi:DNA-binding NarL/FixJ family response regulator